MNMSSIIRSINRGWGRRYAVGWPMFAALREISGPTCVDHCVSAFLITPQAPNLVIVRANVLEIYTGLPCKLKLWSRHELYERIASISVIKSITGGCDRLLLAFHQAKFSIVKFSIELHELLTLSLHYFERDEFKNESRLGASLIVPHTIVESEGRCAAARIYHEFIALFPFEASSEQVLPEMTTSDSINQENSQSINQQPSIILRFDQLDSRIQRVVDFAFLSGFYEPTLAVLFEPVPMFPSHLNQIKDTKHLVFISMDLRTKKFTTVFSMEKLPFDVFKIIALPKPIGGILLLAKNSLIYVDQGASGIGLALNPYAAVASTFPHFSSIFIQQHGSTDFVGNMSKLDITLEDSIAIPFGEGDVLLFLNSGSRYLLKLDRAGRQVSRIHIHELGDGPVASCVTPIASTTANDLIFVGSRSGDGLLLEAQRPSKAPRNQLDEDSKDGLSDILENDPYLDALDAYGGDSEDKNIISEFIEKARLLNIGAIHDFAIGQRLDDPLLDLKDAEKDNEKDAWPQLEIVACTGKGVGAALHILTDRIYPDIKTRFEVPGGRKIWSIGFGSRDERPFDRYLVISSENSTIVLEVQADEIKELEVSHFYLEGATEFAGSFGGSYVVQVYQAGIRVLDYEAKLLYETPLSLIVPITRVQMQCGDEGVYMVIGLEDGTMRLYELSENGTRQVEAQLGTLIKSLSLYYDSSAMVILLAIIDIDDTLIIFNVPSMEVLFKNDRIVYLPSICIDRSKRMKNEQPANLPKAIILELAITFDGQYYVLVLRTTVELVAFRIYMMQDKSIRLVRLLIRSPAVLALLPLEEGQLASMYPFKNIQERFDGIFVAGKVPTVMIFDGYGVLQVHPLRTDFPISSFAPFHGADCSYGTVFLDVKDNVTIMQWPNDINVIDGFVVKKSLVRERTPLSIEYHGSSQTYTMISMTAREFTLPQDDYSAISDNLEAILPPDATMPKVPCFKIELVSPITWTAVDSIELLSYEHVTCVVSANLTTKQTSSGRKPFIVVGTVYVKGEDRPSRGRVLIIDIVNIVPEPGRPETNHKYKILHIEEMRGPVSALCEINGNLLVALGTKVLIHAFEDDEKLTGVAFVDTGIWITSVLAVKNFFAVADSGKSVSFYGFQEEPPKIILLARDFANMPTTTMEFMIDGKNGNLAKVVVDEYGCLHLFMYTPLTVGGSGVGQRLLTRAVLKMEGSIIKLQRLALQSSNQSNVTDARISTQQGVIYATSDGAFGIVAPMNERPFRRLQTLASKISQLLPHPAGLNPRSARRPPSFVATRHAVYDKLGGSNQQSRNMLDIKLMDRFMNCSIPMRDELARHVGATMESIVKDIEDIKHSSDLF